jgi:dTDP-4-amino-4,6-dideoxygalactose transaminase
MIRLTVPSIEEDDLAAVREVLTSGFLVQGPKVKDFEDAMAAQVGTKHCVAVTNCTAALHLALQAIGVGPGDLVAVTTYSWITTANVIELCGAQPVFVDVDPRTFNMDPAALERRLAELAKLGETKRRLKAVLPVHTFGQMADVDALGAIAAKAGLPLIEDAACALGATFQGKQAGSVGLAGAFSFHPRKAITTGEGGALTTNDDALARTLRALRNHGQDPTPEPGATDPFVMPGHNTRMTEMQGAMGVTQMKKLGRIVAARKRLAARYDERFRGTHVTPPHVPAGSGHVYQSYVTLLPEAAAASRPAILATLKERGVETTIGTWHMPMTQFFRTKYGFRKGDFPVTDAVFARALTLPLFESMTDAQVDEVASAVLDVVARG